MKQTLEFGDPINSIRRLIENKLRFKANLTEIVQIENQGLKCKRCQRWMTILNVIKDLIERNQGNQP